DVVHVVDRQVLAARRVHADVGRCGDRGHGEARPDRLVDVFLGLLDLDLDAPLTGFVEVDDGGIHPDLVAGVVVHVHGAVDVDVLHLLGNASVTGRDARDRVG